MTSHHHSPHRHEPCATRITSITHHSPPRHTHTHSHHIHTHEKDVSKKASPYRSTTARQTPAKHSHSTFNVHQSASKFESSTYNKQNTSRFAEAGAYESPEKNHTYRKPSTVKEEAKQITSCYHSPEKSVIKTAIYRCHDSPLKGDEEKQLVESFLRLLDLEKELEKSKQMLAHRRDFTVHDAFKIFDVSRLGKINSYDLKQVFTSFGLYISLEEAKLIMSRFDRNRDEYLTFEEFVDMWVPLDPVFATSLDSRSNRHPTGYYSTDDILDAVTRADFVYVLKKTLEVETFVEGVRQKHIDRPLFNMSDAFDTVNKEGGMFVEKEDFSNLLKRHRFFATNKELNMLMDRFDKDKDRRVSYSEFISEITPHSPQKF